MITLRTAVQLGAALVLAVTLGACRGEEQNRSLSYNKGVYSGKPDTPVSQQARRGMRERMVFQGGLSGIDRGGGGGGAAPADVRQPAISPGALRQRGRGQGFKR